MVRLRIFEHSWFALLLVARLMRAPASAFLLAVGLVLLAACSAPAPDGAVEPSGTGVFEGTPEEYNLLYRACLEERGIATADLPPGDEEPGFLIGTEGVTAEQREEARAECRDEVGEPKMENLSEGELRERYDARLEQYECLTANGLVSGDPPTFEVFVSDYERSGQRLLWEPAAGVPLIERDDGTMQGPTQVCPRSGQAW